MSTPTVTPALRLHDTLRSIPQHPQRQDSLTDQMRILAMFANKLGLYDAATFLEDRVGKVG